MKTYPVDGLEISVIIPCYNAEKTIVQQLLAFEEQNNAPRFEIIISNNRCTDNTVAVVEEFARHSALNIYVADASGEQGINFARNVGIAHASAPYVMICDADDVVGINWLQFGLKNFELYKIWSGSAIPVADTDYPDKVSDVRAIFDQPQQQWEPPVLEQTGIFQVLMGGNFGAEKKYLERLGGFDLAAPSPGDDNELALRVLKQGDPIPVSKHVLIGYRGRTSPEFITRSYYTGALAHAWLVTQYGLAHASPYGNPLINLVKTHLLLPLKHLGPHHRRKREELAHRRSAARGYARGFWKYKILKKDSQRRIGEGWLS